MPIQTLSDGRKLYFEERGSGPCLVLLNGMSQSTANWHSHTRSLSEQFRLIVYDAQGQGRSPLGDRPMSLEGHVSDLIELLDELGVSAATLCGFSHGGRIALATAARHPSRVSRLILTSVGDGEDAYRRTIVRSWREVLRFGGLEAMAWAATPDILGREFVAGIEPHLDAMIRATLQRNTSEGLGALLDAMASFPSPVDDARRVNCPSLLISSDDDRLVSPTSAHRLADALGAETCLIANSGHTSPVERPVEWRSAVVGFAAAATS